MNLASDVRSPLAGFEPLLQAPARLQVMAVLSHAQEIEFSRLKEITDSSDSVMSKHLAALAEAGFLKVRKATSDGRQRTWASITRPGRCAFDAHVEALQRIVAAPDRS